ncbi:hypothetical protein BaRGS_00012206 [Batillaria attramentaria]|uniref:Uncharacterized protein n=1 Tax=Batillaria attramentaria TaxID=370345 RepID=A0ABD0LBM8_9CAEN
MLITTPEPEEAWRVSDVEGTVPLAIHRLTSPRQTSYSEEEMSFQASEKTSSCDHFKALSATVYYQLSPLGAG